MGFIKNPHVAKVLPLLLQDKTTKHPIIWATDTYAHLGGEFTDTAPIRPEALLWHPELLRPRIQKSQEDQQSRTRKRAEVFTPAWLCNAMVNALDADWFSQDAVFTKEEKDGTWTTVEAPIPFPEDKSWRDYVDSRRLEMTCGEAPFLVSRYDASTGEFIASPKRRIGILDRKLRVVSENTKEEEEWLFWTFRAYEACYGYEVQGDSLLIARINLLLTFVDAYEERWGRVPEEGLLRRLANKIAWNLWQMDGLTGTVPLGKPGGGYEQLSLFHTLDDTPVAAPCTLYDWRRRTPLTLGQIKEMRAMKKKLFDYVIGNPPYQKETQDTSDKPIYNEFMDAAFEVADKVELIHPARFLSRVGKTPKEWNEERLNDPHFKVLRYELKSQRFFPTTEIEGGIAITYRDETKDYGPILTFTAFPELQSILRKAGPQDKKDSLVPIIYNQLRFDVDALFAEHPESRHLLGSDGKDRRFLTNSFEKLELFTSEPTDESDLKIIGLIKNIRYWKYIPARFVDHSHENLNAYKVIVPKANGSGALGGVLSTPLIGEPLIGEPLIGYTQSFLGFGSFDNKQEAEALLKYVKSKFARTMLGVLKVTQDNPRNTWRYVPLQDFTPQSDIDWSGTVPEIDQQLYKKYGLSPEEIDFIETHVKEMV